MQPRVMHQSILPLAVSVMLAGCGGPVAGEDFAPWPFAEDSATLSCYVGRVYVTMPDGKKYGVNGTAKGDAPDVAKITTHWNTQPLIDRGSKLCEYGNPSLVIVRPKVSAATPSPLPTGATVAVEDGDLVLRSTAAPTAGGKSPSVSLSCGESAKPFIYIETGSPPTRPPALRTDGTMTFDGKEQTAAFAWTPDDHWIVREETDTVGILKQALRSKALRLTLAEAAVPAGPITWDMTIAPSEREAMRKACRL